MKKATQLTLLLALLGVGQTTHAFELATHGALTSQAYQRSILNTGSTPLRDLGFDPNDAAPFGGIYFDVSGEQVRERVASVVFEGPTIQRLGIAPLSVPGWLMRGAIREDDLGFAFGQTVGEDPHDDPYGPFWRVMNHFYDPARDRPLTLSQVSASLFQQATGEGTNFHRAPDWAVGSRDAFAQPNVPEADRRNHFTIFDAREAMYRALTGRDSQGNPLQPVVGGRLIAQAAIRHGYWATAFRALGDVLHLNQDMAQPQHTRNDTHGGAPGFGKESVFEAYIEARATGVPSYEIDGTTTAPQPLVYGGYPIPAFPSYSNYWSTREGPTGRGLADYSNRGFFSAGSNLGSNTYAAPSNNAATYAKESATGLLAASPLRKVNFLRGDVPDTLNTAASANIRMTTESAFDRFLLATPPAYSLNRFNYDDMAGLVIPRAVAYSAGLINYFFRGKIDLLPDPNNTGRHLVRNLGTEPMKGKFRLFYDDLDGNRLPVAGAGGQEVVWDTEVLLADVNGTLAAGTDMPVPGFLPPTAPAPKTPGEYMLVFSGDMGEERAEAGSVGAVAAKLIRNEYKGALNVVGLDANGVITSLRVDKDGTKVILGWDISKRDANNPNGVLVLPSNSVFDPLGRLYGSSVTKAVLEKAQAFKQSEFGPGPIEYETNSVTLIHPDNVNNRWSYYGANLAEVRFGDVVWVARSPDDQLGTFEFQLTEIEINGRNAATNFTRRFKDATGASRVLTGYIRLPTLPSPFSYEQFKGKIPPGNSSSPLVISDDGLTIQGFATTGLNSRVHTRIVVELAATPQFRLEQTVYPVVTSGLGSFNPAFQPGAPCSVDYRQIPNGAPGTMTATGSIRVGTNEFVSSLKEPIPIGNLGGRIVAYEREGLVTRSERVDESFCYVAPVDFDPVTKVQRKKYSIRNTADNDLRNGGGTFARFVDGDYLLPAGNVPSGTTTVAQVLDGYFGAPFLCRVCRWNQVYEGFDPVPFVEVVQKGAPFRRDAVGRRVVRPITDRHADAVYEESSSDTQPFLRKFRGIVLDGKEYIADSSPLGEVFFAVSDKSVVVHEPVQGGMPPIQIPDNVVKLLAVLWL